VAVYEGQMTRQVTMGTFGVGGWGQVPLPRGTLVFTAHGVEATQHGWFAAVVNSQPWACDYREIQIVESIRVSQIFRAIWVSGSKLGIRIDRGPWMTRLVFMTDSAPELLQHFVTMGVPTSTESHGLPLLLVGRK